MASMSPQVSNRSSMRAQVIYQNLYWISRWLGRMSSRIFFISSNPSGMPGTSGKYTSTTPGVSVSTATALRPQPFRLSLMASRVKLSPPMRSRAARACRRRFRLGATGLRTSRDSMASRPQSSAVEMSISRCTSSRAAPPPSRASPTASSSPPLAVPVSS